MRLKHLHIIGEYKNLKDFKLDFDSTSFIDVFVGKNGTGKSNLFEAFLEIFKHLFDNEYPVRFNYKLHFEIDGRNVELKWLDNSFVNSEDVKSPFIPPNLLPNNILIYYSGHNNVIKNFISSSDEKHKEKINRNRNNPAFNQDDARRFFGIGSEYKTVLLATILLQNKDFNAKKIILEKLGIKSIGTEVKMVLTRPYFAKEKDLYFDEFNEDARFWGADGFFRTFLNQIWILDKLEYKGVREEGYINNDVKEEYILFRSINSFQNVFKDMPLLELFVSLDNLKSIDLLKEVSLEVELTSGKKVDISQFSDGQFQSIYIFAITELFKDKNCITLLDEPDSFLHPEWQFDFFKQLNDISAESSESNHILMSSHSAITLIKYIKDKVNYFDISEKKGLVSSQIPKKIAINKLSKNIIKLHEQEQLLSIINTIQIENKPIVFTEGKTDPLILKVAFEKLYPDDDMPFIPFYCFGHKSVAQIMRDEDIQKDMNGLPIFGLFDFDKAYNTFNGFNDNFLINDYSSGVVKQLEGKDVYAIMLPVPDNGIKQQVINSVTGECYNDKSVMTIEHLFYSYLNPDKFKVDTSTPGNPKRFNGEKVPFAKNTIPDLPVEAFEIFRPMFGFIKNKIPQT